MENSSSQAAFTSSFGKPLDLKARIRTNALDYSLLGIIVLVFLAISGLYFVNLLRWSQEPDFGWTVVTRKRALEIVHLTKHARAAGLKVGDRFLSVNGQAVNSLGQVREYLDRQVPGENYYHVSSGGAAYTVVVQNTPKGLARTFLTYGMTWLLGLFSFLLGALVFFMKPGTRSSWAFLLAAFAAGLFVTLSMTGRLVPSGLYPVLTFGATFTSAAVIHLALVFPAERGWVRGRKMPVVIPYLVSAVFFLLVVSRTLIYTDTPKYLLYPVETYRGLAIFFFIGSVLFTYRKTRIPLDRVRSGIVLFGAFASLFLPIFDMFLGMAAGIAIFSHPAYYFPFYMIFPLAIGYAVARHNLFGIDVFIKRAVGYAILTALVVGAYVILAMSSRFFVVLIPGLKDLSGLYPILFALLVVVFFRPLEEKLRTAVDKVFFRRKFDYRDTVISLSESLTSMLDLKEVLARIIHTVRDNMFIDSVGVILLEPAGHGCPAIFVRDVPEKVKTEETVENCLGRNDPIVALMEREKKMVTIYDLRENPKYENVRVSCLKRFEELQTSLALPLIFQKELSGILALGQKKSGHLYSGVDIELLWTLANQGALAIENARLAEKMKAEEVVRANLARYLSPQVVQSVMDRKVDIGLGGNRKIVTVLISDIRGFTALTETHPPDQLVAILNEYFTEMAQIIFRHQGSLDKYIGDAIVSVFGSLIDVEKQAEQAVDASVEMMMQMAKLNGKWAIEHRGFHMEIGVGIDKGEVFLGNMGSLERMEFTVIGKPVNSASALSDLAEAGQVLITRDVAQTLREKYHVKELATLEGGKNKGVVVYEVAYEKASVKSTSRFKG